MSSPAPASPYLTKSADKPVSRRKGSKTLLWVIVGAVVLVALLAGVGISKKRGVPKVSVTTEKAVVKTITQIVSATGKIQPETEVKISPEVAGEIIELPFKEGASVKKGDLLVKIKPDNYVYQVEQREADLAAARASSLDSKARLQKAEDDLRRSQDLFDKKLIPESEHSAVRTAYEGAHALMENSLAQIRRAEGLLKQARDQLQKTTVYAPIDGTVSSRTSEVGERVVATGQFSGTEIMRVADLANMEVRVNINENDIVNVKLGDKARVTIDAFPGKKFDAVVKEIGSAAKTTGQNTQEEVTNFQVKIRILDKSIPVRPGMSANADIETKTVENVVAVPIQSVTVRSRDEAKTLEQLEQDRQKKTEETKGEGNATAVNDKQQKQQQRTDRDNTRRVVFLRQGDAVKMVAVETGIGDTTHLEIKSGIKEGDEIVSGSYAAITRTLKDGMKVQIEQKKKEGVR